MKQSVRLYTGKLTYKINHNVFISLFSLPFWKKDRRERINKKEYIKVRERSLLL